MEESFWKQTYEKILIGMGLFGITLNFLFLNQILPFLGALLLFTGFRKLRLENRWLKAGYAGAALKVVITIVNIVIGSVLEREKIYVSYERDRPALGMRSYQFAQSDRAMLCVRNENL